MSSQAGTAPLMEPVRDELSHAPASKTSSNHPRKAYDIAKYEDTQYYVLPESEIPQGWFYGPEQLQECPKPKFLAKLGFKIDEEQPIAVIMCDDGSDILLFEFQGRFFLWNPIASVLHSVPGADSINTVLDELHKGHEIAGPVIPYLSERATGQT